MYSMIYDCFILIFELLDVKNFFFFFFFFNDTATTEIYTLSLHERSSDLDAATANGILVLNTAEASTLSTAEHALRSEEHTSELQSRRDLVCRLLLEKK